MQMDIVSQANPDQAMKLKKLDSGPMDIPEEESIGEFEPPSESEKKKKKKSKKHKTGRVP